MSLPNLTRLRAWLLALRPGPADHSTEAGRGRDRMRRVAWSALSSAVVTAAGLAVSLITIPLTVHYLGPERYGVWMTLSSLLSWLAISDLGFGSVALINALSEARGRGDHTATRAYVSTAFFALCGIALILGALFAVAFPLVSWPAVFNVRGLVDETELTEAVLAALACFLLMFPGNLVHAVCAGHQETYVAHAWGVAGHLASLVALVLVTRGEGSLPALVMALSGTRMAVVLLSLLYLFTLRHREAAPRWRATSRAAFARLGHLGWKYLAQNLTAMAMFQSQPILIAQFLGPAAVGIYSITYKLLTIPQMVAQFFLMPLVPAYGEARGRRDWGWMKRTLRRSVKLSVVTGFLLTLPLMLAAGWIIRAWVGPALVPPASLVIALGLYSAISAVVSALAVYFTGLEKIGSLAVIGALNALLTLGLAFLLLPRWGLAGMGWAMLVAYAAANLGGQLILLRRTTRSGESA